MQEYFSHDFNTRNDINVVGLRVKYGMQGYGIYFSILEMLYCKNGFLKVDSCDRIAFELREDVEIVKDIIFNFELFKSDGEKFWSESANRRIQERKEKSVKARESARVRWGNANASELPCEGNALNKTKVKQIKLNTTYTKEVLENVVVQRMIKWFSGMSSIKNPKAYALFCFKEFGEKSIKRALDKEDHSASAGKTEFLKFCEQFKNST